MSFNNFGDKKPAQFFAAGSLSYQRMLKEGKWITNLI